MQQQRTLLALMVCALIGSGAVASRAILSRNSDRQAEEDLHLILEGLRNAPPPPLRETATITPYEVDSEHGVVEHGGPERAHSGFMADNLGLRVEIDIHTCRPMIPYQGELNIVDGTREDLCTSGGVLRIFDDERGEEFHIFFKLMGAPSGSINWNARQLVSPRAGRETWIELLERLRGDLPPYDLPRLPSNARLAGDRISIHDAANPASRLIAGEADEVRRMLSYREAFRLLYADPNPQQAKRAAWLLIDNLLESPEQQELSGQWIEELQGLELQSSSEAFRDQASLPLRRP